MKDSYDVLIVGAGINGLACGAYLAKAGLEVAVVEKRNECGPFALTEDIFGAGVPVDTHAGVCFLPMSPVWGDLELGKFGLEILFPEIGGGTVWADKNLMYYSSNRQKTAEAIAQFSPKDAKTFLHLAAQFAPRAVEIAERAVFSPPTAEGEDYLFSLGELVGFKAHDLRTMNGMEAPRTAVRERIRAHQHAWDGQYRRVRRSLGERRRSRDDLARLDRSDRSAARRDAQPRACSGPMLSSSRWHTPAQFTGG